jgi:hypothetical protein
MHTQTIVHKMNLSHMKKDLKGTMKPGAIYKKSIPEI